MILPQWNVFFFVVIVVVVMQNEKSFRLVCCSKSVFSTVKLVKSKHCSIHKHEKACSQRAFKADCLTNLGLHTDVHRGVHANPRKPSQTLADPRGRG